MMTVIDSKTVVFGTDASCKVVGVATRINKLDVNLICSSEGQEFPKKITWEIDSEKNLVQSDRDNASNPPIKFSRCK
jgi:hypothetical protein